jgi:6-hydroxycyclohex-1-ene-1-carbonyl-CoA dehydrogenase
MDTVDIRLSNLMAFNATAHGNWGCLPQYYKPVLDLVLAGRVKIGPFAKRFPLEEINAVFKMVHAHEIQQRPILVP